MPYNPLMFKTPSTISTVKQHVTPTAKIANRISTEKPGFAITDNVKRKLANVSPCTQLFTQCFFNLGQVHVIVKVFDTILISGKKKKSNYSEPHKI